MINETKYFNRYIQDVIKQNTPEVIAKLCRVVSYNNQFVEVAMTNQEAGQYNLKDVPVVSSKYVRPFVQPGDYGLLINLRNSFYNELVGKDNTYTPCDTYAFLPIISKDEIVTANNNGNNMVITSPDKNNVINYSNSGLTEKLKMKSETIQTTYTNNVTGNATITSNALLTLKSSSPISVSASGEGAKLGAMLAEILNAICTALSDAGVPIIIGDCSAQQNASLPGDISKIKAMITRLQKIIA